MPRSRTPAPPADPRLRRLDALGRLLDDSIPVPGTRRRIGVDAVIGLVPGLGDGAGAILSTYIIVEAARFGVPRATLLRMAANVAAEAILGVIPIVGDLFDATWKANLRNLRLLHAHLERPDRAERTSRRWAWGIVGGLIVLLAAVAAAAVWLGAAVVQMLVT